MKNHSASILILEDDPSLGPALQMLLSVHFNAVLVTSLESGIKILESSIFDVALLDKVIAQDNGLDLIPHLKRQCPKCAIIVVTGHHDLASASEAFRRGADDYVVKSESMLADLLIRIQLALRRGGVSDSRTHTLGLRQDSLPSKMSDLTPQYYRDFIAAAEREFLDRAFLLCSGSYDDVSRLLGISRSTVFNRARQLCINPRLYRQRTFHSEKSEAL